MRNGLGKLTRKQVCFPIGRECSIGMQGSLTVTVTVLTLSPLAPGWAQRKPEASHGNIPQPPMQKKLTSAPRGRQLTASAVAQSSTTHSWDRVLSSSVAAEPHVSPMGPELAMAQALSLSALCTINTKWPLPSNAGESHL